MSMQNSIQMLLDLSHQLGNEKRGFAILGEGNTSTRLDDDGFAVKASGSSLSNLDVQGVARCRRAQILELFEHPEFSDDEIETALLDSRAYEEDRKPSTEALFHAYLLGLPDVELRRPHASDWRQFHRLLTARRRVREQAIVSRRNRLLRRRVRCWCPTSIRACRSPEKSAMKSKRFVKRGIACRA